MIIDLRTLKKSGKDVSEFYFEYSPKSELIDVPFVSLDMPLRINGSVTITGNHSAYVEGEINFSASGGCTRCLRQSKNEYVFYFNEEVFPDNTQGYSLINDKIDLSTIVVDTIITDFPLVFLCKEDCRGICSGCGVNLNDEKCKCEK